MRGDVGTSETALVIGETMAFHELDGLVLVVHHQQLPPSDGDWGQFVSWAARKIDRGHSLRLLAITGTGPPSAPQRGQFSSALPDLHTALLIADPKVRTVAKVFMWFMPHTKAFAMGELDEALAYLGCEHSRALDSVLAQLVNAMRRTDISPMTESQAGS